MIISRRWANILGIVFLACGIILLITFVGLWSAEIKNTAGIVGSIAISVIGLYFWKLYNPDESITAKKKIQAQTIVENRQKQALAALRAWCPNPAVMLSGTGSYQLSSDATPTSLAECKNHVSKRISARERELNSAIREFERQDRKAISDRTRRTASRTSLTRTGQDIRAGLSGMSADLANSKVNAIENDIENLHRLENWIADRLEKHPSQHVAAHETEVARTQSHASEFCRNCGATIRSEDYFCPGCGRELVQNI